jgi:hypothetical protein
MNRTKRPISNKLSKKIAKSIRNAQIGIPSPEIRRYSDELTAKEMLKAYPKKQARKKEELLNSMKKSVEAKRAKSKKMVSKRTTPGTIPSNSSPASTQREGARWIRTLTSQTRTQRTIDQRRSRKK